MILSVVILFYGCDKDFGEINTNKNAPEEVSPELLLPDILRDVFSFEVNQSFRIGNTAADFIVKSFADGPGRYDWTTNGAWSNCYSNIRDLSAMTEAAERENKPLYKGVALVLSSYLYGINTQLHGDIPYSEAGSAKTENNFKPRFDEQEEVFKGIINDLEIANALLSSEGSLSGDIVYDGSPLLWRKFANSYRLRLLLRLSKKWDVAPMIRQIVENPAKYPIITSHSESFSLAFLSSSPNQYPMYTYRLGDITDQRLGKLLADTLLSYQDSRIEAYAEPTPNSVIANKPIYVGVPNGMYNAATNNYNGGEANQSHISTRYSENPSTTHHIMHYAEVQFILAEAALNGWIDGSAKAFYETGITVAHQAVDASFDPVYLDSPKVAFSSNEQIAFRQIIIQKWLASFFYGMEAYFEYRRTGIPNIIPGSDNVNEDRVPMRFRYPTEEQDLNKENYDTAIARQGKDDINTLMWLLK